MKTTVIDFTLSSLIALLEHEGIDLSSVKISLKNDATDESLTEGMLVDLIEIAKKDLEQIQSESTRLDFLLENRIRVEKWNTNPSTQYYFIMNEDDESIAKELDGRDAIDAAIKFLEEECND
ncbi:hypothetical protein [Acinetobacter ursingii]|uniref:hypothetical protein n=1 Tax=Acinetobacter ursingii TaxID=108980 RepID=UPI0021CDB832|nr:hypothetical protein [Acinetobacter ursingii]MCU4601893.1 hypothetical protein [Acinetobacter ursingii]